MKRPVLGMSPTSVAVGLVAAAVLHAVVLLLFELPSSSGGRPPSAASRVSVPIPAETASQPRRVASAEDDNPPAPVDERRAEPKDEPEAADEDRPRIVETPEVRGEQDGAETGEVPLERPDPDTEDAVASREAETPPEEPSPERPADLERPAADTEPASAGRADDANGTGAGERSPRREPATPTVALPGAEASAASPGTTEHAPAETETAAEPGAAGAGGESSDASASLGGIEIVRASGGGPIASVRGDPDAMPPVVVNWANPSEAQGVARRLSFQIVAVDGEGAMLGQVAKVGDPRLIPIDRPGQSYSNRARVIEDPLFFGPGVQRAAEGRVEAFWILVPSRVDRALEWKVRGALRKAGLRSVDVAYVEGHFETSGGEDRLRIDRLHVLDGAGADADGAGD